MGTEPHGMGLSKVVADDIGSSAVLTPGPSLGRQVEVINPRHVDWASEEGRRLLGLQHWDEGYWVPGRGRRWWPKP